MLDVPLGTLIFRAGLLAEEQLEDALQEGMRTGKRLGEVLLERGWLHERDLGRLLAGQKGLPFVEVSGSESELEALQAIPEEKARLQCALPLRYEDGQLVVAVADPSNELVLENLRRTLGAEPRLVVATHGDLMRAIGEAYAQMPAPAPAAAPVPEPVAAPAPQPEAMPTSLRPGPSIEVEPVAAPALTPMPTVLPPAEERSPEAAEVPPLQPMVAEQAPPVEPPAAPVEEAPAPLLEPPAAPVEEAPAPLLEPPAALVEETPAPLLEPPAATVEEAPAPLAEPPVAEPEATDPAVAPLLQPAEPAPDPPPVAASVAAPVLETAPPPSVLTPPAVEGPVEASPAPLVEQPVMETPDPVPTMEPVTSSDLHIVLLRLRDGDLLEVGTFQTAADAAARAQEVVRQIAAAEGEATWPFFAERYLRPDTIVSVDLLEESAQKWMGSAVRSRSFHAQD